MSFAVSQPPPAKPRPGVVNVASILLYVTAALLVCQVLLSFLSISDVNKAVSDFEATHPDLQGAGNQVGTIIGSVVQLLLAAGFVTLGLLVGKGKQPARIVTWVLSGLGVLCVGCGTLFAAALPSMMSGNQDLAELTTAINDAIPAWQRVASTVSGIATLLILITVIILLALPAANDYFRKEQEVWVPPTDWNQGGYPQVPPPAAPPYPPGPPAPPAPPAQ